MPMLPPLLSDALRCRLPAEGRFEPLLFVAACSSGAGGHRPLAHRLYRRQHVVGLIVVRLAQCGCPERLRLIVFSTAGNWHSDLTLGFHG